MTCSSNILAVTSSSAASTALHMDTPASSPSNSVEDRIAMHAMMASPPSDFSIDHILNRAGKWMNIQRPQYHEPSSDKLRSSFVDPTSLPVLNWLHYTRYHPPRPQSMYSGNQSHILSNHNLYASPTAHRKRPTQASQTYTRSTAARPIFHPPTERARRRLQTVVVP